MRILFIFLILNSVSVLNLSDVLAMPHFARKYKVSCQMCHTVYPKLNAFGEAYRIRGYRLSPTGGDAAEKASDVSQPGKILGAIADTFPAGGVSHLRFQDVKTAHHTFELHELQFFFGGSLGKTFSFWADFKPIDEGEHPGTPFGRSFVSAHNPLGGNNLFNIRLGYFEPETNAFSSHRRLQLQHYLYHDIRVVNAGSASPNAFRGRDSQVGAELFGVLGGRLYYAGGMVNGSGNIDDRGTLKDYYGRLAWKPAGMNFNGTEGGEDGIRIGAFLYHGETDYITPQFVNHFYRYGGDIQWGYHDFELAALIQQGHDRDQNGVGDNVDTTSFFAEMTYFLKSWIMPAIRYEQFNFGDKSNDQERVVMSLNTLLSPNFRTSVEGAYNPDDGKEGRNSLIFEARYAF